MMRLILASKSYARLESLRNAGLDPEAIPSGVDEERMDYYSLRYSPEGVKGTVETLATAKANAVASRFEETDAVVLGCDSLLEFDGKVYGKPETSEIAYERWKAMRGNSAELHTGHCLIDLRRGHVSPTDPDSIAPTLLTTSVATKVIFSNPTDHEIAQYLTSGEPGDAAGGFTIDGQGGWFVQAVVGDPLNVVGVSLSTLHDMLKEFDLNLSDFGWPRPKFVSLPDWPLPKEEPPPPGRLRRLLRRR
jgi:septum formation protein